MSEGIEETGGAGPSHRSVEIGVALAIAAIGLVSIFGSLQVGIGWGADGPRAGFFPFYCGVIIVISSAVNLARIFMSEHDGELFASWSQLRQVTVVVVPTAVYVALVPYIGIYVASALLIALFMKWLGRYPWTIVIPIAVGMPVLTFLTFEIWFLVPLPKGPLESMLGY
ncbi:MAG TPA: tripartite tricarboxylate transporter TctB family protein [Pseudolabrys sp.]|nr:tripartite tricarboxylate transporter TctB family protein [Pseudolabrys sp.]